MLNLTPKSSNKISNLLFSVLYVGQVKNYHMSVTITMGLHNKI